MRNDFSHKLLQAKERNLAISAGIQVMPDVVSFIPEAISQISLAPATQNTVGRFVSGLNPEAGGPNQPTRGPQAGLKPGACVPT